MFEDAFYNRRSIWYGVFFQWKYKIENKSSNGKPEGAMRRIRRSIAYSKLKFQVFHSSKPGCQYTTFTLLFFIKLCNFKLWMTWCLIFPSYWLKLFSSMSFIHSWGSCSKIFSKIKKDSIPYLASFFYCYCKSTPLLCIL